MTHHREYVGNPSLETREQIDRAMDDQYTVGSGRPSAPLSPGSGGGPSGGHPSDVSTIHNGWVWVRDSFGDWEPVYELRDGPGGRGSSSSWSGQYVNDALTAAAQAIQGFLSGQSLADARKLAAAEQFQKMAAFSLPAGVDPPGYEPGGVASRYAARRGQEYTPPQFERREVNPAMLEQAGQVPDSVMSFIDKMLAAADKGKVVTTGGSQSSSG